MINKQPAGHYNNFKMNTYFLKYKIKYKFGYAYYVSTPVM